MFTVKTDFSGANANIIKIDGNNILLDVELRDTKGDWFFWCFKVCGAAGQTLNFQFTNDFRVGYYGAAISYDFENWHWQYSTPNYDGNSFTYSFKEDENEVYFAHDMVYRPERFLRYANEHNYTIKTLCKSEKGRDIPYFDTEKGDKAIIITSRHHACESTGTYVLEGFLEEAVNALSDKFRIICVPFVDYDGVVDGDQGKNRNWHDHNRDYDEDTAPRYVTTAALRKIANELNVKYAFDFHSPWHLGEENDTLFIPIGSLKMVDNITRYSEILEKEMTNDAYPFYEKNNFMPDVKWNTAETPTFKRYMMRKGAKLTMTVETAYFKVNGLPFSPERAFNTGKCFAKALKKYDLK